MHPSLKFKFAIAMRQVTDQFRGTTGSYMVQDLTIANIGVQFVRVVRTVTDDAHETVYITPAYGDRTALELMLRVAKGMSDEQLSNLAEASVAEWNVREREADEKWGVR